MKLAIISTSLREVEASLNRSQQRKSKENREVFVLFFLQDFLMTKLSDSTLGCEIPWDFARALQLASLAV